MFKSRFPSHSTFLVTLLLVACDEAAVSQTPEEKKAVTPEVPANPAATRAQLDQTVYRDERDAQAHEQTLVTLWDRLRTENPWEVLGSQRFQSLTLLAKGQTGAEKWGIPGIRVTSFEGKGATLDHASFLQALQQWQEAGWTLEQSEWHHERFDPATDDEPAKSLATATGHLFNAGLNQRMILKGKLAIEWARSPDPETDELPEAGSVTVTDLKMTTRTGEPTFSPMTRFDIADASGGRWKAAQPILLHDLDGDGLSEVILAGASLICRNKGDGVFEHDPIDGLDRPLDGAAIVADFNGDSLVDLIGTPQRSNGLQLLVGQPDGSFAPNPQRCFEQSFQSAQGITAGDIDSDGDLDLFVFQYRQPYVGGQMPTPYYDANDGYPSFLLRNDGKGRFTDITEQAGLAAKRLRRTYSACFIDLNGDHHLDLSVVSDFAGIDLHENNGQGGFTDVSETMIDQPHAFGMAQTLDDFNGDGELDLYMVGMSSTTARRIVSLGIDHPDHPVESKLRSAMGYGNRLYLSQKGSFHTSPSGGLVARTGWSWGVSSADFDNDGDRDLYVANGHISGESCHDYCTRFWSHDIYTNNSNKNPIIEQVFLGELQSMIKRQTSWNGYEKNVLYLHDGNGDYLNAAYLLGVGFEFDSRAVASDDLDGDGLVDLLVVELDQSRRSEVVHFLRNALDSSGNWVGVRLRPSAKGPSPLGARVFAYHPNGRKVAVIVAGDSYEAQHAPVAHFGLGDQAVERLEVLWPNGAVTRIKAPARNKYHEVTAPSADDQ